MRKEQKTALFGAAAGACALILGIVTMVLQQDKFTAMIVLGIAGILVSVASALIRSIDFLSAFAPCLYFGAGLFLLATQFTNIGYAITNVNIGDGIMPTFVVSFILFLLATVLQTITTYAREKKG